MTGAQGWLRHALAVWEGESDSKCVVQTFTLGELRALYAALELEVFEGVDCTSCGETFDQCIQGIGAHSGSGCCEACRDYGTNDPHRVSVKGGAG